MKLHEIKQPTIVLAVAQDIVDAIDSINKAWAKDFGGGQPLVHYSTAGNGEHTIVVLKADSNFDESHFIDVLDHIDEMLETEGHDDGVLPINITKVRGGGRASYSIEKMLKKESTEHKVPFFRQAAYKFYQELEMEQKHVEGDNVWMDIKIHHMAVARGGPKGNYCSQVVLTTWNSTPKEVAEHMREFSTRLFEEQYGPDTVMPIRSKRTIDHRAGGGVTSYFEFWPLKEDHAAK